ncbi:Smr/MutS family protein [Chloroflexota bacterium]
MPTVFGKESSGFYSAHLIPDPVKRRAALYDWIDSITPVIQAAVKEELGAYVEGILESSSAEKMWIYNAKKFRGMQSTGHYFVMKIILEAINPHEKYIGEIPTPIIPKTEIDLHEKTVKESIPLVEDFLNESYNANLRKVRIIHGKGIGVLRQAIRDYLENHRLVKSFLSADKNHGGDGATDVEIIDLIIS